MDKISIIIPVYNIEDYVEKCILSIINQTYSKLEIILVDDGSTDASSEICDKFAKLDNRIIVIHKEHEGLVKTRIAGMKIATGDFITVVDGDDWIDNEMCEVMLDISKKSGADVVDIGYWKEFKTTSIEMPKNVVRGEYRRNTFESFLYPYALRVGENMGISHSIWGKLYKKKIYVECQRLVDAAVNIGEDLAFFYALLLRIDSYITEEVYLYHYRQRESSIIHNVDEGIFKNVESLYLNIKNIEKKYGVNEILYYQIRLYLQQMIVRYSGTALGQNVFKIYMVPWHLIPKGSNIALYGAGNVGKSFYEQLRRTEYCSLQVWVDNIYLAYQRKGYCVRPVSDLKKINYDYILIAVKDTEVKNKIEADLKSLNNEKVYIWERPIAIPYSFLIGK